jgi:hypothetical protein
MASYKIEWKTSAGKELRTLPKAVTSEIVDRVARLADDPSLLALRSSRAQNTPIAFASVHTASYTPFQEITGLWK